MLPVEIRCANERLVKHFVFTILFMVFYGLLIPADWRYAFGPFAYPMSWAVDNIPSIHKLSAISEIPDLIDGFFGLAFWVSIFSALLISKNDPLGHRLAFGFSRPGVSFIKNFLFVYFLSLPILFIAFWVVLYLPIAINPSSGNSFGAKVLIFMVQNRYFMAAIGGFTSASVALLIWMLIVIVIGPIGLLKSRSGSWK